MVMRPRYVTMMMSMAMLAAIGGCSKPEDQSTNGYASAPSAAANLEVVDAVEYLKNVPRYEGRLVHIYLDKVMPPGSISNPGDAIASMDMRDSSLYGVLEFSESALKKWQAMGLDPERFYTVTFAVRATDLTEGKKAIYDLKVENFKVNYDGGALYGGDAPSRELGPNGLPVGEISLPVAMTVKDVRQLELFPAQFKDKKVRIGMIILKDQIAPHDDKYLLMESQGNLKILAKKDLVQPQFSTWSPMERIEIIGKVVTNGAQTSVLGEEVILTK